jgi:hypothetical protein
VRENNATLGGLAKGYFVEAPQLAAMQLIRPQSSKAVNTLKTNLKMLLHPLSIKLVGHAW